MEGKSVYLQAKGDLGGKQKTVVNHFSVRTLGRAILKQGNREVEVVMGARGKTYVNITDGGKLVHTISV